MEILSLIISLDKFLDQKVFALEKQRFDTYCQISLQKDVLILMPTHRGINVPIFS